MLLFGFQSIITLRRGGDKAVCNSALEVTRNQQLQEFQRRGRKLRRHGERRRIGKTSARKTFPLNISPRSHPIKRAHKLDESTVKFPRSWEPEKPFLCRPRIAACTVDLRTIQNLPPWDRLCWLPFMIASKLLHKATAVLSERWSEKRLNYAKA